MNHLINNSASRKIIHIDMDAFYASVEQLDNPQLRGQPIAVGGSKERGVVAAASYEARKYGVRSAMASSIAKRQCPPLIFVRPRFDRYKEISNQIRGIFHDYTDLVEPLSLDEAYLDVTENKKGIKTATLVAKAIREDIFNRTGLNASAGISYNKFLAKIASDINKPNGWKVILPEEAISFLETLEVRKFHGIGKVTAKKMHDIGIHTGADLKAIDPNELFRRFGKAGLYYHDIVRGIDKRIVNPNHIRKSISAERTFTDNIHTSQDIAHEITNVSKILEERIKKENFKGYTLTLKLKYADFKIISRSITLGQTITTAQDITPFTLDLMNSVDLGSNTIRLIGIRVSNSNTETNSNNDEQLSLGAL